ncbi:MAG: DUF72 domain-containing protein [Candidatus Diapherotrites archaeon]
MIKVGCCGWGYYKTSDASKTKSILQAYCLNYECIEVNYTFYKIPKLSTVSRWRKEADEINKNFEFIVKCPRVITHLEQFSHSSVQIFENVKDICYSLRSTTVVFQTPPSFGPSEKNISKMKNFFEKIERDKLTLVWEPRGEWLTQVEKVKHLCDSLNLIECTDLFRKKPMSFSDEKIAYLRLHGLGKESPYQYKFTSDDLKWLAERVGEINKIVDKIFVMFNNFAMYEDAIEFKKVLGLD